MIMQIQEEVAETLKAEAQRDHTDLRIKTTAKPSNSTTEKVKLAAENEELWNIDEMYDEEENKNDEENYYDEDGELDDDDEEVMTQCPDYCKCAGQYAAATTATYVLQLL